MTQFNIFSLYLESVKYGPCTSSETSKSSNKFKEDSDVLQRYKIIKSKKVILYTLQTYFDFVFLYYIVYIQSKFSMISFQRILLGVSFHKKPICHVYTGHFKTSWKSFYNNCKSGAIYSLLPMLKKSYMVHVPEKHISLLQFLKYTMLKLLIKCFKRVWNRFEILYSSRLWILCIWILLGAEWHSLRFVFIHN